jgi:hypothetical protein
MATQNKRSNEFEYLVICDEIVHCENKIPKLCESEVNKGPDVPCYRSTGLSGIVYFDLVI